MNTVFNDDIVWQVHMPIETAAANPWNAASQTATGGSAAYQNYCFSRLYRTFAHFKKDPSNILDVGIKAGAQAEFKDESLISNRVGAPAVYIEFTHTIVDPNGAITHKIQTFPFRILCHGHGSNVAPEAYTADFRSGIATLRDSTHAMRTDLVDTSAIAIAAGDWEIEDIFGVTRNLTGTQVAFQPNANPVSYPFTETAHPKYAKFLHNAIGNLFEIRDFVCTQTHVILRDFYWEPSEFTNIMLVFNNYGKDYAGHREPYAYRLYANDGVTGVYSTDQAGTGATANDQQLGQQQGPAGDATLTGLNRVSMSIPLTRSH